VAARCLSAGISLCFVLNLTLGLLATRPALAQSATDSASAESLFNEALALLAQEKPAEACRKLEESQHLDPGVGTLLYLADCYQQLGRTASAWATFREAAYLAKDKADNREHVAIEHARALEAKLSYLTLDVSPEPGVSLEIQHDGKAMGQALWGTAIPVDPGPHALQASAPGKQPWSRTVNVPDGPHEERVSVPRLLDVEPEPAVAVKPLPLAPPRPSPSKNQQTPIGWALLGVGSAAVITGVVLIVAARDDDKDAQAQCRPDRVSLCSPAGVELGNSARTKATWAGVSTGVGVAALAAGVTLLLTAPEQTTPAVGEIALQTNLTPRGGQLTLSTTW
jgi:hypothetical protein